MSAEIKTVEEKLKRDQEPLPLEEMTLAEVGMDIPFELAAGKRWLPTDCINVRKYFTADDGTIYGQIILCEAINHGYYDYALALIATYRRKDKIGLDPKIPGSHIFVEDDEHYAIYPINLIVLLFQNDSRPFFALLLSEIIQAGATLSRSESVEFTKKNRIFWRMGHIPLDKMPMPLDYIIDYDTWSKTPLYHHDTIPLRNPITPIVKQFFVNLQFYTEAPIRDKPEVKSIKEFKEMVDAAIPLGQKMNPNIFNLICEYLPFTSIIPLQETITMYSEPREKECREKLLEILEVFLRKQFEEYQKEQRELEILEVSRMKKEEEEKQRQELVRMPSEVRSLKAMAVKQADMIVRQSETIQQLSKTVEQLRDMNKQQQDMSRKQGEQFSQFMSMFQQFMMKDRVGSAAEVFSAIPGTDSLSDHFEIELDGASAKAKAKEKVELKAKSSNS